MSGHVGNIVMTTAPARGTAASTASSAAETRSRQRQGERRCAGIAGYWDQALLVRIAAAGCAGDQPLLALLIVYGIATMMLETDGGHEAAASADRFRPKDRGVDPNSRRNCFAALREKFRDPGRATYGAGNGAPMGGVTSEWSFTCAATSRPDG